MTARADVSRDRIASLDIIRGVAVMGIFSVNVVAFAMIFPAYMNPGAFGGFSGENLVIWLVNYILIDGKMRSLFSMLFGASMLLVLDRAKTSGQSPARVHFARMLVLLLFGLIHFYLIWHGDILTLYAVTGMIAFTFRGHGQKAMVGWAVGLMLLSVLMFGGLTSVMRESDLAAHRTGATASEVRRWNEMASFAIRPATENALETRMARADIATRTRHMILDRGGEPLGNALAFLPTTLALMLFGMVGYRSGFLTGEWEDRHYRQIAAWALGLGALATLGLAMWLVASNFYIPFLFFAFVPLGQPIQLAMAFGYAALIVLLSRRNGKVAQRFSAVGRMALSNYLGTSILAAFIFYGDGLGWFGTVTRFEAWLIVPIFWLIMLAWSQPWLNRFRYGPLEWLWRSLLRLELQPMRKPARTPAAIV